MSIKTKIITVLFFIALCVFAFCALLHALPTTERIVDVKITEAPINGKIDLIITMIITAGILIALCYPYKHTRERLERPLHNLTRDQLIQYAYEIKAIDKEFNFIGWDKTVILELILNYELRNHF